MEFDDNDLRETASKGLPLSKQVLSDAIEHSGYTPGGQLITARIGQMAQGAPAGSGRSENKQYENQKRSMEKRHEATGISPATILNFLPIPLVVNSPMADLRVRIDPAPLTTDGTDAFSFHVWHECAIEVNNLGENMLAPVDFYPIMLAQAFMDEYKDFGGVVLFKGLPDERTLAKPEIREAIEAARNQMTFWMTKKVDEGNMEWNSPNHQGAKNIVELHRQCALRLKDQGLIDHLPEWVTETRMLRDVAIKCGSCGNTPKTDAVRCPCGFILNPAKAYLINDIAEDDLSLERLTREEVIELGISLYVAETKDEKGARLKAGRPKPMSQAAVMAMAAEQGQPLTAL